MPANANRILTSWKQIATYLGKSVRTVQRWERELSLPVRRPMPSDPHIVIAVPEELDEWVKRQMPCGARGNADRARLRAEVSARRSRLVELRSQLLRVTEAVLRQCRYVLNGSAARARPKPR